MATTNCNIIEINGKVYTIAERVREESEYIIRTGATVRDVAKIFGVSRSTVHNDITEKCILIDPSLQKEVMKVLLKNKRERAMRGGEAIKKKLKGC